MAPAGRARRASSALVLATSVTAALAAVRFFDLRGRGLSALEIAARQTIASSVSFALVYLWARFLERYPHMARPRTRHVLRFLGWSVLVVAIGLALGLVAICLLP
jgi:hypothetical protein